MKAYQPYLEPISKRPYSKPNARLSTPHIITGISTMPSSHPILENLDETGTPCIIAVMAYPEEVTVMVTRIESLVHVVPSPDDINPALLP